MAEITMYSTGTCPYCVQAQTLLERKGVTVNKIMVDQQPQELELMIARSGRRTVPQIFINEKHVGGFSELHQLDQAGQLDTLLLKPSN
jgi:glutaredoxin 3